jgi:hypothetical protein
VQSVIRKCRRQKLRDVVTTSTECASESGFMFKIK